MQPINYLLQNKSPLDALLGGVNQWQTMRQNDNTLAQQEEQNRIAQAQNDHKINAMKGLESLDFNDLNAVRQFAAQFPDYAKGVSDYAAQLDEKERQGMLSNMSKASSLIRNGNAAAAAQLAKDIAAAYTNTGNSAKAAEYTQIAQMIEQSPDAAYQHLMMNYALIAPKDAANSYKDFMGANTPTAKEFNAGGETGAMIVDPVTGQVTYKKLTDNSVSPDVVAQETTKVENNKRDNATSRANNLTTNQTQIQTTGMNNAGALERQRLTTQSNERIEQAKLYYQKQQSEITSGYFEPKPMNGMMYLVNKRGEYKKMLDEQGNHMAANGAVDSTTRGKVAEIQGLNDSANQTIAQLTRAKELSKQGIYSGYRASGRADAMGFFGGTEESERTQEYTNIIVNSALQSLKSVFGGAPTEGERAMLIKVQASAEYPPEVRDKILDDAIAMARARIESNNRQIATLTGRGYPAASAPPASIAAPQSSGKINQFFTGN